MYIRDTQELKKAVERAVASTKIIDIHTHLFTTDFNELLLWGIDELLTYHYLVAETMRHTNVSYEAFWNMSKTQQADLVWDTLFIRNSPYSEACRGVLTVLKSLGLDTEQRDLNVFRKYFKQYRASEYIDKVLDIAGISSLVMTNDPFEDSEREIWLNGYSENNVFKAALRIDPLLNDWKNSHIKLQTWGYDVTEVLNDKTLSEIRRFLSEWINKMKALYMAVSLPPTFIVPEDSVRSRIIEECIIPVSYEKNIPFAMMIGVKKLVNPQLRLAGDSVGKGSIETVEYLCSKYPQNKFLVTMLSRENQHELCVAARKFRNLMIFGCWWFLNNPSLIEEITKMRFELLGSSMIPQHSDARVLDQLIYKWAHSRKIIGDVLFDKYKDILSTGWIIEESEIQRDVEKIFSKNFNDFLEVRF